jgi:hypothetical protein
MMCPIFPDVMDEGRLDELVDRIAPERCEEVFAEPFNDRQNWAFVRGGYRPGSPGWEWMTRAFERNERDAWSEYATRLYAQLRLRAEAQGWLGKLRFMLYEHGIQPEHARTYCDLKGLLLQSPGDPDKRSKNPHFRALQEQIRPVTAWDRVASSYEVLEAIA